MYSKLNRRLLIGILIAAVLAPLPRADAASVRVRWINGEPFVALRDMAAFYGMQYLRPNARTIELKSRWSSLRFDVKSREVKINGTAVWMHEGPRSFNSDYIITRSDAQRIIDPIMRPPVHLKSGGLPRIVVIDPGHGGKDAGAVGSRNVQEKLAALDIAKRTRAHLQKMGIKALLTREGDQFISLDQRLVKAKSWKADLFVSIHLNAASSASARGIETYILTSPGFPSSNTADRKRIKKTRYPGTPFDHRSTVAGISIQKHMVAATRAPDRGLRLARFYVLKNAVFPAVLVEGGFLSNSHEQNLILSADYRDKIAEGIANGILEYFNQCRRTHL